MTQSEPKFLPGDRVFTHYEMQWGTVVKRNNTVRGAEHGVTGSKLPDTTWYTIELDNGERTMLDDAHGDWEMARIMPSEIAERYGYGTDPKVSA